MDTMMTTRSEMASFGQDNAQAFLKSGQIWSSGCQAIGHTAATAMQAHFDHLMAGWKAMSGVKSFKEAVDMQASLMRTSVENAVASTSNFTGAALTLVEESMVPLTQRMTLTAEQFTLRAN